MNEKAKNKTSDAVQALNVYARKVAWNVGRATAYPDHPNSSEIIIGCVGSICLERWQILLYLKDMIGEFDLVPAVNTIAHRALENLYELTKNNHDVAFIIASLLSNIESDYLEEFTEKKK